MTDFEGPKTYEAGLEYMRNKFTSLIKPERKSQLYHHFTCMCIYRFVTSSASRSTLIQTLSVNRRD